MACCRLLIVVACVACRLLCAVCGLLFVVGCWLAVVVPCSLFGVRCSLCVDCLPSYALLDGFRFILWYAVVWCFLVCVCSVLFVVVDVAVMCRSLFAVGC